MKAQQPQANIKLHIKQIVLHGFDGADRQQISAAIIQELSQLLTARGIPPVLAQGAALNYLNAGSFQFNNTAAAQVTGIKTARALYQGMNQRIRPTAPEPFSATQAARTVK